MQSLDLIVEPFRAQPRPPEQLAALFAGGWPAFIDSDHVAGDALPRIRELFADWELAVLDPATGELVAAGWAVPLRWGGEASFLPAGYSDSLTRALRDHDDAAAVDTAVICAVQVRPDRGGTGVATRLLGGLVDTAAARGLTRVIAPLRPTSKHRHPNTTIQQYAQWTRPDGTAYDGWLRTHLAMGARVIATAPASQVFTAPVDSWRQWTDLALPRSGDYLVPAALAPLVVDLGSGVGRLTEPCIWVQHR